MSSYFTANGPLWHTSDGDSVQPGWRVDADCGESVITRIVTPRLTTAQRKQRCPGCAEAVRAALLGKPRVIKEATLQHPAVRNG